MTGILLGIWLSAHPPIDPATAPGSRAATPALTPQTANNDADADANAVRARARQLHTAGKLSDALAEWNRIGEPRIASLHVSGATRTRESAAVAATGLSPGDRLTPARWERAWRRLRDLPATVATIMYTPLAGGEVSVEITLDDATLLPSGFFGIAAVGAEAAFLQDVQVPISNPAHRADVLLTAYRWPSEWRRYLSEWTVPVGGPLHGIIDVQASWERQTYAALEDGLSTIEDHTQAAFAWSDWVGGMFRWRGGASFDKWNMRRHVGLTGTGDVRLAGDRISLGAQGDSWFSNAAESGFNRTAVWSAWRSTPNPSRDVWTVFAERNSTSATSPFDLWTGAGAGVGRAPLLRAHSVLDDNILGGETFGRTLAHATVEFNHPVTEISGAHVGVGFFVDTARAWHRLDGTASPWLADAGFGIRLSAPGLASVVRLDVAHGLRDNNLAVSLAWQPPWPR